MNDMPHEDEELLSEEVYEAFQDEALELLNKWASICLEMEKNYEKSQCDNLFRVLHTLKGSSHCVALLEYGNLVHKVEELIHHLREGDLKVGQQLISLLLDCQQRLLDWANVVLSDPKHKPPVNDLYDRLEQYLEPLEGQEGKGEAKNSDHALPHESNVDPKLGSTPDESDETTILIVDDEVAIVELVSATFRSIANVLTATNGKKALEIFAEHKQIDLIITDIFMPELDGISLVKKIRKVSRIPVLVMSGLMKERFQELNTYENIYTIDKPLETGKLMLFVQMAIKNYREQEMENG
ncbi:MAG: response regulator [Oligoflexales bacterium]|nr:response regulator [Oligoflexales bacterium]